MWRLLFVVLLWGPWAWSFPEMVRHGYTQCTACHISPAGGGVLSSYGRELAGELLSTWSYKDEAQFLHSSYGAKLADQGILVGGDVRGVQYRYENPQGLNGKLFLMEANIDPTYQSEHFAGVVSIGQVVDPLSNAPRGSLNSTMYYGLLRFTDEFNLRTGRFVPEFGLNLPDHTTVIKAGLGFTPTLQYDSVEASYLSEHWTVLATAGRTLGNTGASLQEFATALDVSYSFFNRMRVGASYWRGQGPQLGRQMYGINGILGFSKKFYNLTEIDLEAQSQQDGSYALTQWAYEVYRGVIPYLQLQRQQTNMSDSTTLQTYYGAGAHFFPRPHFELSGEWDHIRSYNQWADSAYLMGHYYF